MWSRALHRTYKLLSPLEVQHDHWVIGAGLEVHATTLPRKLPIALPMTNRGTQDVGHVP